MYIEVQKIQDLIEFVDLISGTDIRLKQDRARNPPPITKAAQTRVRTTLGHPIKSTSRQLTQLVRTSTTPAPLSRQYSATPSRPKQITERPTTALPAASITCYNCGEAGYTCPECPYPRRNANLNKIVEQEDNNNNIEEI
jgi:hypothetical protein